MLIESLRNLARSHSKTAAAVASIPLLVAGLLLYRGAAPPTPPWPMADYIDEETGEQSVRRADEIPPLEGAGGRPTVVRAVYLTPSTPEHKFIGYLEKFTDAARARAAAARSAETGVLPPGFDGLKRGILVRRPEPGSAWLDADSPEGMKMLDQIIRPDPSGKALRLCPPDLSVNHRGSARGGPQ